MRRSSKTIAARRARRPFSRPSVMRPAYACLPLCDGGPMSITGLTAGFHLVIFAKRSPPARGSSTDRLAHITRESVW